MASAVKAQVKPQPLNFFSPSSSSPLVKVLRSRRARLPFAKNAKPDIFLASFEPGSVLPRASVVKIPASNAFSSGILGGKVAQVRGSRVGDPEFSSTSQPLSGRPPASLHVSFAPDFDSNLVSPLHEQIRQYIMNRNPNCSSSPTRPLRQVGVWAW